MVFQTCSFASLPMEKTTCLICCVRERCSIDERRIVKQHRAAHFDDPTNPLSLFHDATAQLGGLNVGVHNDGQPFVLTSETIKHLPS
ncbi:hypothetical protein M404DRAFT_1000803 [Pisolithus tinctorius Marx 270]|uniref:Uncharacterized protein n=1 Tax=Pisolithus tinctorius Marx 270 TaxID=870435 RepID=A0A0C3P8X6_PISTI|nr:hypothetical protein M404DRAFT_1000803 [Pisolithus tinctorius Marx 270]